MKKIIFIVVAVLSISAANAQDSLNTSNTVIKPRRKKLNTRGRTPWRINWLMTDPRVAPIKKKEVP